MRENCWIIKPKAPKEFFEKFPECDAITSQLLFNRGIIDQIDIDNFFYPDYCEDLHDPNSMKDMDKAVSRVVEAVKNGERILVYGDYDADGVCGATVLREALRKIGGKPMVYIPDRNKEGYGLNLESVKLLSGKDIDLIITVDCGVSDYSEVELANSLGMDVIIIDHHTVPPKLPKAYAIIDPKQAEDKYPFKDLAATGVAFKFASALFKKKGINNEQEKWLLDLVAIATITDRMLLLGENRTLVKYGLIVLTKTKRRGLKELLKSLGKEDARSVKSERRKFDIFGLSARDLGFMIGPRLNAAGRIDHANTSFKLLNVKKEDEAKRLVEKLDKTNKERRIICEKIMDEVLKKIGDSPKEKIIIEGSKDWPVGVVGLIAGKISEKYSRPALVYHKGEEESDGSARTIKSFNIIEALRKASDLLGEHGGHAMAAGFHIKNKNLDAFKKRMQEIATDEVKDSDLIPEIEIDAELNSKLLNIDDQISNLWELYEIVEDFKPFGPGNDEPVFLLRNCEVKDLRLVGKNGTKHLKMAVNNEGMLIDCIGFRLGGWYDKIKIGDKIDMVFSLMLNEWNGNRNLEFNIIDLRKTNL
jgi:single-stranded-DNA-specific exonuclease